MGLFSAISGLFSGGTQKKASQRATDATIAALNRGIDLQEQQYQQTRSDYLPYTQAGTRAIGAYGDLLGSNGGDAQTAAIASLQGSPFYQQSLNDANENLLQTAAATGGVRGGNTAGAVAQISPAILAQYYQNALSGYGNLAQLGLGATGSVASAGLANANAATSLNQGIGQAQATNYLTKAGINARNINNFGSLLDNAVAAGLPGGGAGGFNLTSALKSIF